MNSKKEIALQAIQDLFGDTNVSPEQTLEELEELADEIDMLVNALKEDLG